MNSMSEKILAFEQACFGENAWKSVVLSEYSVVVLRGCGYALGVQSGDEYELLRIGVLPEYRGQGHGFALMSAFLEECEGNSVFLEVAAGNTAAVNLYEKCGFRETGRRRGYYNGDDAIVMGKFSKKA
jgi:ribosomal-protein-alanine N-acetyltransferase